MGGLWEPAGTQSPRMAEVDCRLAAAFTKIGQVQAALLEHVARENDRVRQETAKLQELNALVTELQTALDRATSHTLLYPTEGTS